MYYGTETSTTSDFLPSVQAILRSSFFGIRTRTLATPKDGCVRLALYTDGNDWCMNMAAKTFTSWLKNGMAPSVWEKDGYLRNITPVQIADAKWPSLTRALNVNGNNLSTSDALATLATFVLRSGGTFAHRGEGLWAFGLGEKIDFEVKTKSGSSPRWNDSWSMAGAIRDACDVSLRKLARYKVPMALLSKNLEVDMPQNLMIECMTPAADEPPLDPAALDPEPSTPTQTVLCSKCKTGGKGTFYMVNQELMCKTCFDKEATPDDMCTLCRTKKAVHNIASRRVFGEGDKRLCEDCMSDFASVL